MGKRAHICDVPGCGAHRPRYFRLCSRCFAMLPGDIRTSIADSKQQRRTRDWRAACKRAAAFLNDRSHTSVERAIKLQQAILGERRWTDD